MDPRDCMVVSLDNLSQEEIGRAIDSLWPYYGTYKTGLENIMAQTLDKLTSRINDTSCGIWVDCKLHDIPRTVLRASEKTILWPHVTVFNVHCSGGKEMMRAAKSACMSKPPSEGSYPTVLGVTLLTSLGFEDLVEIGLLPEPPGTLSEEEKQGQITKRVVRLALLAKEAGLDGVVASPLEIAEIRKTCGSDFEINTPGVRSDGISRHDQKRVGTPAQAILAGARRIVTGSQIFDSSDWVDASKRLYDEVGQALEGRKQP